MIRSGTVFFLLLVCASPDAALAQAPGWSRGQQNLIISYDECVKRAPMALQAEGYRIDYAAGDFAVGIKAVHAAVIMCNPAGANMWVNIVVASNGDGGGIERQKLQAQMERPATHISVTSATLGANCGAPKGNRTSAVSGICNGKDRCPLSGADVRNPDPKVGCEKDFEVEYQCTGGAGGILATKNSSAPASPNETAALSPELSCP
jgi:hypothetical protein